MEHLTEQYIKITSDLPKETQLQIIAYSFKEICFEESPIVLHQFIDVFKLFNSRPVLTITFCTSCSVRFRLSLPNKSTIQFNIRFSYLKSDTKLLSEFLKFKIKKVIIDSMILGSVLNEEHEFAQHIPEFLNKIDSPIIELNDPCFFFTGVYSWYDKITHMKYTGSYNDLLQIKDKFTSLSNLTVEIRGSTITEDWFNLIPSCNKNRKLTLNFVYLDPTNSEISNYIESCGGCEGEIEIKITKACVQLNSETLKFYSNLNGINTLRLHHCEPPFDYGFGMYSTPLKYDLLPKIENIRKLVIETDNLKDTILKNDSVSDLIISCSSYVNLNLMGLTKLTTILFQSENSKNYKENVTKFNVETFKLIPNRVAKIQICTEVSIITDNENENENNYQHQLLPLPKYLQEFNCNTINLHMFDFSKCEHLRSLILTKDKEEVPDQWGAPPCHMNKFKLQFCISDPNDSNGFSKKNYSNYYNNDKTNTNKQIGVTISDENNHRGEIEFSIGHQLTQDLVCINTDLPSNAKQLLESSIPYSMNHSRINISPELNIKLFIYEFSDPIVLCYDDIAKNIYTFKKKNHYKKAGEIEGLSILCPNDKYYGLKILDIEPNNDYY